MNPDVTLARSLLNAWKLTALELSSRQGISGAGLEPGALAPNEMAFSELFPEYEKEIGELWQAYNVERQELRKLSLTRRRHAIAYMLGMHVPNIARAFGAIQRAAERFDVLNRLRQARQIKVIDIGCGAGAMSLAWWQALKLGDGPGPELSFELVDVSRYLLDAAERQLRLAGFRQEIVSRCCRIEEAYLDQILGGDASGRVLIVNLGYILNEIEKNHRAVQKFSGLLERVTAEDALILCIEPAKQRSTRSLMQLRDDLLEAGVVPLYPCPSAQPCPMLLKSRDWCFSEISYQRPLQLADLDQKLGRDTSEMAAAAHVHATRGFHAQLNRRQADPLQVVVGRPFKKAAPGRPQRPSDFRYLVCSLGELVQHPPGSLRPPLRRGSLLPASPPAGPDKDAKGSDKAGSKQA